MCAACGDSGYINADETATSTIAIRRWCGVAPRVLVPCRCNPIYRLTKTAKREIKSDNNTA